MTENTANDCDVCLILAPVMRKLHVVKKTLKDSFKTPLCSRDNSLRLKCSREKGLIYFYDIKEAKLNNSLCS